jgi:S-adenosylmethionine synthetase
VSRRRAAGPLGIVLEQEAIVLQPPEGALGDAVAAFDLRPRGIIQMLDLLLYEKTAAYGHFGREEPGEFTWDATDKALALKQAA